MLRLRLSRRRRVSTLRRRLAFGRTLRRGTPRCWRRAAASGTRPRPPRATLRRRASGSSVVKHRVEMVELDASVVGGEAPVDGADGGVALGQPGYDLLFEGLAVRQAAVETLAGED